MNLTIYYTLGYVCMYECITLFSKSSETNEDYFYTQTRQNDFFFYHHQVTFLEWWVITHSVKFSVQEVNDRVPISLVSISLWLKVYWVPDDETMRKILRSLSNILHKTVFIRVTETKSKTRVPQKILSILPIRKRNWEAGKSKYSTWTKWKYET